MKPADAIKLIEKAINGTAPQHWADLGCGNGTFTRALASLLPEGSKVIAIDKERQNLPDFIQADFINDDLQLGPMDGILMANSLHFVKDKLKLIANLNPPKLLIVEYDTTRSNPWVPYPVSYPNLAQLAAEMGYDAVRLATQSSKFGGTMYSALLRRQTLFD
ncbi:MAG: class I SAM-dependent methyltransferase [Bacteroidota bacterium]